MTSNLGSEYLASQRDGEDTGKVRDEVMGVVRSHFRPEFLNRVDEIILFHRLRRDNMAAIVDIQFGRLQRLLVDRKIVLDLDAQARAWLADKGYDPVYGARPLKRAIQKAVQDPLAELILAGDIRDGAHVPITVGRDGLRIGERAASEADTEPGSDDGACRELPKRVMLVGCPAKSPDTLLPHCLAFSVDGIGRSSVGRGRP